MNMKNNIKTLRKSNGFTQEELAKELKRKSRHGIS